MSSEWEKCLSFSFLVMELRKVSVISYDKKDTELLTCPQCKSSNFSLFLITQKENKKQHLHIRCVFCDLTFCPDNKILESLEK